MGRGTFRFLVSASVLGEEPPGSKSAAGNAGFLESAPMALQSSRLSKVGIPLAGLHDNRRGGRIRRGLAQAIETAVAAGALPRAVDVDGGGC